MLTGKCVVLGVSGGIAAYKACEVVSRLKKAGANVRVVMTENACRFVSPLTFETLSGNPVYTDSFARGWEIEHISLAKSADIMLVAPATANIIGKIAIAPAMNTVMWKSDANQDNIKTLLSRGFTLIGPESGRLACGDEDIGRMSEPEEIVSEITRLLIPRRDFAGKTVLVTAGPTREMLDPVRFLSNRSTGKMGYAIAEAALARGARVELVSGPVELTPPLGASVTRVQSTLDLYDAVTRIAKNADIVIQAAAPADFRPAAFSDTKIKKTGEDMNLSLTANPDIAKKLGEDKRPGQILVAFAAETNDVYENALGKLKRKNADLIIANDVTKPGAGFAGDTNIIAILSREGVREYPMLTKREAADQILNAISEIQ